MPTLNWIGKAAVEKHHQDVPYRLLESVPELSCGDSDSGNLIVQGDNLHALKALLPRYAGQVKCIYIDPPYNTGNEGWVYNDNVNSPEIRKWLGAVVGKEGETLDRHDRWLCMMYPRLLLLKQFLSDDGVIFVSIDDNEVTYLRLLMDEIFGQNNFISQISNVNNPKGRSDDKYIATAHEYILIYKKTGLSKLSGFEPDFKITKRYNKTDNANQVYREIDLRKTGEGDRRIERPNMYYPFLYNKETLDFRPALLDEVIPDGYISIYPRKSDSEDGRWRWGIDTSLENIKKLYPKYMPTKKQWSVFEKDFLHEKIEVKPTSVWDFKDVNSERGTELFIKDLGFNKKDFSYPKPLGTIERILKIATDKDSIILDSFAGSGTTAHAVLNLNKQDNGNRKFILVEMDETIAQTVTAERNKRVIEGYTNAKGEKVEGLGGGFQFCRLSKEPLFTADGQVHADVTFSQLADFVWLTETKTGYTGKADSPLLGVFNGRAIYLLYNGILGDKDPDKGNVLTPAIFKSLPVFQGQKVIYATARRGGDSWLKREQIIVKQTPYKLGV